MAVSAARTPLPAFGHRLVGQADNIELPAAGLADMHLHVDFAGIDALKCHRVDMRNGHCRSPKPAQNLAARQTVGKT